MLTKKIFSNQPPHSYFSSLLQSSGGKIPNIPFPDPTPKFGDLSPKEPQSLGFPRPQSVPKHYKSCNPISIPKIWGVLGIFPPKNPEVWGFPIPKVSPNIFKVLTQSPKFGGVSGINLN